MNENEQAYNVDSFTVNLASTIYMLTYIPINFPAEYILDDVSLKWGVKIRFFVIW